MVRNSALLALCLSALTVNASDLSGKEPSNDAKPKLESSTKKNSEALEFNWLIEGAVEESKKIVKIPVGIAQFGSFRVLSKQRAIIAGNIGSESPSHFARMLLKYPDISQLDFLDCPGSEDDHANFQLGRLIRKAGIATHVPEGGWIGPGGIDLFLSGAKRSAHANVEFVTSSWLDEDGMEAIDYPQDDPAHQLYIEYYREMGMDEGKARAFYALTISVTSDKSLYLTPQDIAAYIPLN